MDAATEAIKAWADDFNTRHHGPRDPETIRHLYERVEPAALDDRNGVVRRAMATLEYSIFVSALVHFGTEESARDKVKLASQITGAPIGRRLYYDKVDRATFFMAGCLFMASDATQRTAAA